MSGPARRRLLMLALAVLLSACTVPPHSVLPYPLFRGMGDGHPREHADWN